MDGPFCKVHLTFLENLSGFTLCSYLLSFELRGSPVMETELGSYLDFTDKESKAEQLS